MDTLTSRQSEICSLVTKGPMSRSQLAAQLSKSVSESTLLRDLQELTDKGLIVKQGTNRDIVYAAAGNVQKSQPDKKPLFTTESQETKIKATATGDAPPLVKFQITNPVTYLIRWFRKIIGNEGIEIRFKLKPLTAVMLTIVVIGLTSGGYGLAGILWFVNKTPLKNTPIIQYLPQPTPTPNPWREAAFTGTLRSNARDYAFLTTEEGEGITLMLPDNVDLTPYINRRILTIGLYNDKTHTLKIADASDMELLPWYVEPVPTSPPTSRPSLPAGNAGDDQPLEVFCTMDAKLCPDGSAVGRIPPDCDFSPCPRE